MIVAVSCTGLKQLFEHDFIYNALKKSGLQILFHALAACQSPPEKLTG